MSITAITSKTGFSYPPLPFASLYHPRIPRSPHLQTQRSLTTSTRNRNHQLRQTQCRFSRRRLSRVRKSKSRVTTSPVAQLNHQEPRQILRSARTHNASSVVICPVAITRLRAVDSEHFRVARDTDKIWTLEQNAAGQ